MWDAILAFLKGPQTAGAFLFVGILAALIAVWGVTTQRAIARRRATLDYISKGLGDRDLIEAHQKFIELAKEPGGLAPWAEEDKEKTDEAQKIRTVLNEFELIAIGVQLGIIDFELYVRWFRSGVIRYWRHAAPYVFSLRSRLENDAMYHEYEEMVRWLRDNRMPRRGRLFRRWF
jgi:Domain of unknown function (DUF4760)